MVKTFREDEMDERVLSWVLRADTHRVDILSEVDSLNAAAELVRAKEWEDTREQMADFAKTVLGSPLHRFKHGGKVFE